MILFCGIVSATGSVAAFERRGDGARLRVACPSGWALGMRAGDSVAVDGACLTATEVRRGEVEGDGDGGFEGDGFDADLSSETARLCAPLGVGSVVNLERALRLGDEIGGHFVSGHVDGTGEVLESEDDGAGGRRMRFSFPDELRGLLSRKGSVVVSGVSLTVNDADTNSFSVHVIPHTLASTNLGALKIGARANLEADLLARHIARILESRPPSAPVGG